MYQRLLSQHQLSPAVSSGVLCYVPAEDFFADSYGEYPFAVSLARNSVMFSKINLLAYKLLTEALLNAKLTPVQDLRSIEDPQDPIQDLLPFYRLRNAEYRACVERITVGHGVRNVQHIIVTFALLSTLISFSLLALIFGAISSTLFPDIAVTCPPENSPLEM